MIVSHKHTHGPPCRWTASVFTLGHERSAVRNCFVLRPAFAKEFEDAVHSELASVENHQHAQGGHAHFETFSRSVTLHESGTEVGL